MYPVRNLKICLSYAEEYALLINLQPVKLKMCQNGATGKEENPKTQTTGETFYKREDILNS